MKVYITRQLPDEILSLFPREYHVEMYHKSDEPVSQEELLARVPGTNAILCLITERIDAKVMDRAGESLRVIANMAVGYDNIDVEAATARKILVTNTPDVLTETTADLIFGLLIAAARRIPQAEQFLKSGKWRTWSPMLLTGQDVYGKTIGIIGMGRIGQAVARRANGFGMRVIYTSRQRKPDVEKSLKATYMSLSGLLKSADFVVPLTPASKETENLISSSEFALMKQSAILVNASRGSVVDEEALIQALSDHRIFAAGLDVFENEPLSSESSLLQLDNVILLPHIGSASIETRLRMAGLAAQNIKQVLSGEEPSNPVNNF
jgi:glyoxylate reductase